MVNICRNSKHLAVIWKFSKSKDRHWFYNFTEIIIIITGGYLQEGQSSGGLLALDHSAQSAASSSSGSSTTYHGKLAQSGQLSGSAGVDLSSLYRYASGAPTTVTKYLAPSEGTLKAGLSGTVAQGGYKVLTENHLEYYVSKL